MGNKGSSEIPQKFTETQYPKVNNLGLINTEPFCNYTNNSLIFKLIILLLFILIFFYCFIKYKKRI